VKTTNN